MKIKDKPKSKKPKSALGSCTPFGMTYDCLVEFGSEKARELAWFFKAMSSAFAERFELGDGI